jgi:hypothetical protein
MGSTRQWLNLFFSYFYSPHSPLLSLALFSLPLLFSLVLSLPPSTSLSPELGPSAHLPATNPSRELQLSMADLGVSKLELGPGGADTASRDRSEQATARGWRRGCCFSSRRQAGFSLGRRRISSWRRGEEGEYRDESSLRCSESSSPVDPRGGTRAPQMAGGFGSAARLDLASGSSGRVPIGRQQPTPCSTWPAAACTVFTLAGGSTCRCCSMSPTSL